MQISVADSKLFRESDTLTHLGDVRRFSGKHSVPTRYGYRKTPFLVLFKAALKSAVSELLFRHFKVFKMPSELDPYVVTFFA